MHLLLITHYFPPESNAPANRAIEHARAWLADGHRVTVVTAAPSHPGGVVYPGYANRYAVEQVDGVEVIRLPTLVAANRGIFARSFGFLSFFASVALHRGRIPPADAVISTSPQFFSGLAGWLLKRSGRPWVLEIRDLWPESIVAVGATGRNAAIRLLERLERWAYRTADLIVTTTEAHRRHVTALAPATPAVVVRNGVTPGVLAAGQDDRARFREASGLTGKYVLSYVGTHGMAHGLDIVLEAADALRDRLDIHWLLVGDGAERERIAARAAAMALPNLTMLGQQGRNAIPAIWAASDAALVVLRESPTFTGVLPSKLAEAMSLGKPVILGVAGEAAEFLAAAEGGIVIPPGDATALAGAAVRLAADPEAAAAMGASGRSYVEAQLDRRTLARRMSDAIAALP